MQISRRVTNGLAWAGLLLVVGVPSADIISAQVMGEGASPQAAVVGRPIVLEPAKPRLDEVEGEDVAAARTAPVPAERPERPQVATATTTGNDPVDRYLQSGRQLPSYISGGGETQTAAAPVAEETQTASVPPDGGSIPATQAPGTKPATIETARVEGTLTPATTAPGAGDPVDPVEVASIDPGQKVAPVPMPLSMRPAPVARPAATQEALVIPDDEPAPGFPAVVPDTEGFPVVPPRDIAPQDDIVSAEELEGWESGPLSEFLAQRGGGSAEPEVDSNGFFLDEAPGSNANYRRRQLPPDVVYVFPFD